VVYNRKVAPDSRRVAEHYAERRGVPRDQVIGLDLPATENLTRTEYRERLEKPLLKQLEKRGLITYTKTDDDAQRLRPELPPRTATAAKVRFLVLCYGVPLRIVRDPDLAEPGADRLPPELQRNEAAVDNELVFLPISQERRFLLTGPTRNVYFKTITGSVFHPTNGLLIVARLDGPTGALARSLVDRAIAAEQNGFWGRAFFDARGLSDGPYKKGDDWLRAACEVVQRQGFETILDNQPETFSPAYAMPQIAIYAGWYDTAVSGPFTRPEVEFLPGAIAYHLFSFSANTVRSPQSWVGTLIQKGATATMGCVDEPYLDGTPELGVFFARLLNFGFTFGEAAYAAMPMLSWQITVVGDPLYQPFGRHPKALHEDLVRRQSPWLEWSHLRVVNLNLALGQPVPEMIAYLEQEPTTQTSAVLQQKRGDLYVLAEQLAPAADAYRQALELKPSPQQRVHLRLGLATMLTTLGRDADALESYRAFIRENPDHPAQLSVYQKALPLAQRTQQSALAREYQAHIERLTAPPATNSAKP